MNRGEAVAEAARLGREHPDRDVAAWLPQRLEAGGWRVVRVARPGRAMRRKDLRPGVVDAVRPDPSQDVPREPYPYRGG
jgi:hypothetical protein